MPTTCEAFGKIVPCIRVDLIEASQVFGNHRVRKRSGSFGSPTLLLAACLRSDYLNNPLIAPQLSVSSAQGGALLALMK
jgi:hypothetical protein